MQHLWHASSPTAPVSLSHPLTYADRLRIRQPGDAQFALGPHQDGGSVERWERDGYGRGGVYDAVFTGNWEDYDAWDAGRRAVAAQDLYAGLGASSVFRAFQGWLSMSNSGAGEGTLLVNPAVALSAAYSLLRPFFRSVKALQEFEGETAREKFLDERNWVFTAGEEMTSELHGATPGHGQEFPGFETHPHLELDRTMVHMPRVKPGDFVVWHCDSESKPSVICQGVDGNVANENLSHPRRRQDPPRHVGLQRPLHSRLPDDREQRKVRGAPAGCLPRGDPRTGFPRGQGRVGTRRPANRAVFAIDLRLGESAVDGVRETGC